VVPACVFGFVHRLGGTTRHYKGGKCHYPSKATYAASFSASGSKACRMVAALF
jgi:hypothetical protein